MCIILYKERGGNVLKKKVYKRCWDKNDDGAGYAWWDDEIGKWEVVKGLMTWKAFWKSFNKKRFGPDDQVVVHFRIGTSGSKEGEDCTHPFPMSDNDEDLKALRYATENIVLHNGVVGAGKGDLSDTMCAVKDYIVPLFPHIEEKGISDILGEVLEDHKCRWLLTSKDEVLLYGKWVEDDEFEHYYFSNSGYEEPVVYDYGDSGWRGSNSSGYSASRTTVIPIRMYREKMDKLEDFLSQDGKWMWSKWHANERNRAEELQKLLDKPKTALITAGPDKITNPNIEEVIENVPVIVQGYLDEHGDIIFDDDYCITDDLMVCPSCGGDEVKEDGMMDGDLTCTGCGCVFDGATGVILMYNVSSIKRDNYVSCTCCHNEIVVNEWGECPMCETILDADKTADMLLRQKERRVG